MKTTMTLLVMTCLLALPVVPVAAEEKTVLCAAEEEPCSTENVYPANTLIEGSTTNAELSVEVLGMQAVTTCDSTVEEETTTKTGSPQLRGQQTKWQFTSCVDYLGRSCTATAFGLPYQTSYKSLPNMPWVATLMQFEHYFVVMGQPGPPRYRMACQDSNIFTPDINCEYKASEEDKQADEVHEEKGGSNGVRVFHKRFQGGGSPAPPPVIRAGSGGSSASFDEVEFSGSKCTGSNPEFAAEYTVAKPESLWITYVE